MSQTKPFAANRAPAVSGLFYEADPALLAATVHKLLDQGARTAPDAPAPKVLIAPHAGYVYSGPIAASAYATLAPVREQVKRVVLLGPAHRMHVRGLATTSAATWTTPLGPVTIDRAAVDRALTLPGVSTLDDAHRDEHSLEVHLPFLQLALASFTLCPFAVGSATTAEVAAVLDHLWGGDETLIVISTDLSHYLDYDAACASDQAAAAAITALDESGLTEDMACGRVPLRGLLSVARRRGLQIRQLDLRNSGDTAGPRDRVVGYGAFALW